MRLLIEAAIESSLLLLVTLAVMPLLRRQSAALRHFVLSAGLVLAAATPLVPPMVPMPVALRSERLAPPRPGATHAGAAARGAADSAAPAGRVDATSEAAAAVGRAAPAIWIGGALLCLSVLLVGLGRLGRLAAGARSVTTGVWAECADDIRRGYQVRRPVRLLESGEPSLLVTWGLRRPTVLLPREAAAWPEDRVRLVLAHELAHIRRGDWPIQLAAETIRAIYWFNPLAWIACARLRRESEQACDDEVLIGGVNGSEYASQLVEIVRALQPRALTPALSIARTPQLERRVRAMLDANLNRVPASRTTCAAVLLALVAVTVPIAGLAGQTALARVTGSIADTMNGVLPGVTLVLTNVKTEAKHEVRTDATGSYEFAGIPPGEYLLEANLPGFKMMKGSLTLTGQNVQQDLTMQVGSLQETVTVRRSAEGPPPVRSTAARRPLPACAGQPMAGAPAGGVRIGGNIRPPHKIAHISPEYPPGAPTGTVVLQGTIGPSGTIDEISVVSSPDARLTQAAMDAVRQWEFDETLLNCQVVNVAIKVTIHFEQ